MVPEKFNEILEARLNEIRERLGSKAAEYARNNDRLSNFKKAANLMECGMPRAMLGTWSKHVVSITDFILDTEKGINHSDADWNEKIGDAINYLILLEAIIKENSLCKPKSL
jgi:hypothetical protein